jgi:hypothetical protein
MPAGQINQPSADGPTQSRDDFRQRKVCASAAAATELTFAAN